MKKLQFTTPLFIQNDEVYRLERISFHEKVYSESWLQKLLFGHPSLIPVDEIEPIFEGLIPLGMEVPTDAGLIDLIFMNPDGYLTLVETKLWRNPEARRQVVAQIVDYAKQVAEWSYDNLKNAILKAQVSGTDDTDDPMLALANEYSEEVDEKRFIDRVSRNLRLGRFLLLIIGDGIHEDVENLANYLQRTPHIGFTLGLVELAAFYLNPQDENSLFIQPRVLARTREVTRAVVEIRGSIAPSQVQVTIPDEKSSTPGIRKTISEEEFFGELSQSIKPEFIESVRWVLDEAPKHDIEVKWADFGVTFRYYDNITSNLFSFGTFHRGGLFRNTQRLIRQCEKAGISRQIARDYLDGLAKLIPGSRRVKTLTSEVLKLNGKWPPIVLLLSNKELWFNLIDETIEDIRKALEDVDDMI
jgi:uncharacterized protein YlzI (FlbEa/FlbD family)